MRLLPSMPRLSICGAGKPPRVSVTDTVPVGMGNTVALAVGGGRVSVGDGRTGEGSAVGAAACAGALVGCAATGERVGVPFPSSEFRVGVAETVGVAVITRPTYGVAV